jgi:hypothetical protein
MTRSFARSAWLVGTVVVAGCGAMDNPPLGVDGGGSGGGVVTGTGGSTVDVAPPPGSGGMQGGSGGSPVVDMGTPPPPSGSGGMPLPDPGAEGDGDRTIGPNYTANPIIRAQPKGQSFSFGLPLAGSKYYTGAGQRNAVTTRNVGVYIPMEYNPAKPAALIVTQDGNGSNYLKPVIDNLIAAKKIPVMVAMFISNGGGDSVGNERGLEYDTVSGLYAEFVMKEVQDAHEHRPQDHRRSGRPRHTGR